jgi:hypothetical protein
MINRLGGAVSPGSPRRLHRARHILFVIHSAPWAKHMMASKNMTVCDE